MKTGINNDTNNISTTIGFLPSFVDDETEHIDVPEGLSIKDEIRSVLHHPNITTALE